LACISTHPILGTLSLRQVTAMPANERTLA
jgi:hypothetical protein